MDINNSIQKLKDFFSFPTTKEIKIKDGEFLLPNGKTYHLTNLTIEGKEVNLNEPLSYSRMNQINKFSTQIFNEVSDLNREDLQQLAFKGSELTATFSSGEIKTEQLLQKNLSSVQLQFEKNLSLPQEVKSFAKEISKTFTSMLKTNLNPLIAKFYPADAELSGVPGIEKPLAEITSYLKGPKETPSSNIITHSFIADGKEVAKETVVRSDTVDSTITYLKNMLDLMDEKEQANPNLINDAQHKSQIAYLSKALTNAINFKDKGNSWLKSSSVRDELNANKNETLKKAMSEIVSIPANMRYETLEIDGQQKVGFFRLGVISDMRNGWVSLTELKNMKKNPELIATKISEIQTRIKSEEMNKRGLDSAILAQNELVEMKRVPENVDLVIMNRRMALEQQMMQLVEGQIAQNPQMVKNAIEKGGSFDILQVSFLNPKISTLDKPSGWMHDERVEMQDMNEIFKEFSQKKIIFGAKGPALDDQTIYLPSPVGMNLENQEMQLKAYFINTSVQGNIENEDVQKEINHSTMSDLERTHPELVNRILNENILLGKEFGYGVANNLMAEISKEKDIAFGMNCLSGKDRTGVMAKKTMEDVMEREKIDIHSFKDNNKGAILKVIIENTPFHKAVKLNPLFMEDASITVKAKQTLDLIAAGAVEKVRTRSRKFTHEKIPAMLAEQRISVAA